MRKFKLIKEYPGSPELGYITKFNERDEDWSTPNMLIINDCKDYPEFWEGIKEKEFEILNISSKKENDTYDFGTIITFLDTEEPFDKGWQKYWDIYSIKRLSDGEIFSIGDTVRIKKLNNDGRFEISKFYFDCNNEHLLCNGEKCGNGHVNITKIEHVKELLFITEDGKEIFEGTNFWFTNNLFELKYWNCEVMASLASNNYFLSNKPKFFSKEAAEKYIEENKPQYSKKQVINILRGFDKTISEYEDIKDECYVEFINKYK